MTELSERLKREMKNGISARAIGRKAGMSDNTVRRALAGKELDRSTIEKFARYFSLPIEDVYRMAGNLPSMYDPDGDFNERWVMGELWKAIGMLTYSEQLEIHSHVMRLVERRENKTSV